MLFSTAKTMTQLVKKRASERAGSVHVPARLSLLFSNYSYRFTSVRTNELRLGYSLEFGRSFGTCTQKPTESVATQRHRSRLIFIVSGAIIESNVES
jgi:hypothetical protein